MVLWCSSLCNAQSAYLLTINIHKTQKRYVGRSKVAVAGLGEWRVKLQTETETVMPLVCVKRLHSSHPIGWRTGIWIALLCVTKMLHFSPVSVVLHTQALQMKPFFMWWANGVTLFIWSGRNASVLFTELWKQLILASLLHACRLRWHLKYYWSDDEWLILGVWRAIIWYFAKQGDALQLNWFPCARPTAHTLCDV